MLKKLSYILTALMILSLFISSCSKKDKSEPAPPGVVVPEPDPEEPVTHNDYKEKVLLVGIDGLQFEQIDGANAPNLKELFTTKAYTGGQTGTGTQQFTYSGPGWTSILTGTWVDRHTVAGNVDSYRNNAVNIFTYVKENKPNTYTAAVVNWNSLFVFNESQMDQIDYKKHINAQLGNDSLRNITDSVINQLNLNAPDFIFAMYENVDQSGHQYGFGAEYTHEIERFDVELGRLLDAVKERKEKEGEDWLVIVTTDHGRETSGRNHGALEENQKTIFIKMNQEGNESFATFFDDVPNQDYNGLYGYPKQTAIAPTILRHLGIDIMDEWGLGGSPLIGREGTMRLMFADEEQTELFWESGSTSDAKIHRNGELIATVPASDKHYIDEGQGDVGEDIISYTVSIDGSTDYISKKMGD